MAGDYAGRRLVPVEGEITVKRIYDAPEPSLQPPEPETVCSCAFCGDEIYAGNHVFRCEKGTMHFECALPYLQENMSVEMIAACCGLREGIA